MNSGNMNFGGMGFEEQYAQYAQRQQTVQQADEWARFGSTTRNRTRPDAANYTLDILSLGGSASTLYPPMLVAGSVISIQTNIAGSVYTNLQYTNCQAELADVSVHWALTGAGVIPYVGIATDIGALGYDIARSKYQPKEIGSGVTTFLSWGLY